MSSKKLHPDVQAKKDARERGSTPSTGGAVTPASEGAQDGEESEGATQDDASDSGTSHDAKPKPTKETAKARWVAAQERVDTLKKELEEASSELSNSVHGLLDSVGPKFKHGNDVLTVAKRNNTYFLRERSQEEEIPEL